MSRRPLIVFDFDDTLFPTTALRAFSTARVADDPQFALGTGAAELLRAWDALTLVALNNVVRAVGPGAAFAIVSAGDSDWVMAVLREYMPHFWTRLQALDTHVHAGVRASEKSVAIRNEAMMLLDRGFEPDALVVVGDHPLDELAAKDARWTGSDRLVARSFVQIPPTLESAKSDPLRAVCDLGSDLSNVSLSVAQALRPSGCERGPT